MKHASQRTNFFFYFYTPKKRNRPFLFIFLRAGQSRPCQRHPAYYKYSSLIAIRECIYDKIVASTVEETFILYKYIVSTYKLDQNFLKLTLTETQTEYMKHTFQRKNFMKTSSNSLSLKHKQNIWNTPLNVKTWSKPPLTRSHWNTNRIYETHLST